VTIKEFLEHLRREPEAVEFEQVMQLIDQNYDYQPTRFTNGDLINEAGENQGSCKIFYFGQLQALSETETLALFGRYYRDDVLGNPAGEDHANIRTFILDGWAGIRFDGAALREKTLH